MKKPEIKLPKIIRKRASGSYCKYEWYEHPDHSKSWGYEVHLEGTPEEIDKFLRNEKGISRKRRRNAE